MEMTPQRWAYITDYCRQTFGEQDEHLASLMSEAVDAGLPDIAVSADVGRLLMMLTSMTKGRRAIELGTLAGYSGIWIARGLAPNGELITVDIEPAHAAFAARQFERAGVADRVQQRIGPAVETLRELATELGEASCDVVFIDAEKSEYSTYWELARPLVKPGGLFIADNVIQFSSVCIDQENHPLREQIDAMCRSIAGDALFEAVAIPMREGMLVARRNTDD